mmetsp:Transcript_21949/g.33298  ORF Transcript_21949/g.33298 Transcript_21949/m.33298 type:complete len:798 (-) Transcript_21949:1811-4204(-)
MGNSPSKNNDPKNKDETPESEKFRRKAFPGSALLDGTAGLCGIDTTVNGGSMLQQADRMCISSPSKEEVEASKREELRILQERDKNMNPTSALFARALVSEVTDNPNTMTPAKMAEREKKLLRAQDAALRKKAGGKPVGAPGGVGQPSLFGSLAHAIGQGSATASEDESGSAKTTGSSRKSTVEPPSSLQENRAQVVPEKAVKTSKHRITVGLSLSRRHSTLGHPDTVTRQTAFDFNELQDREYKYVSSTDATGWRAGGGECGGVSVQPSSSPMGCEGESEHYYNELTKTSHPQENHKVDAPDTVHIPIIHIDAESPHAVDIVIEALARGEVFIPHMAVLPEALSVNGISPPDLVVRFGCERNEDSPPDEWSNWCLEFMHNQLYEYFHPLGARWMQRPFQITLAKKVRWKTVKHMNRYFSHAERVLDAWREKGPQHLDPHLSYIEGRATPEEVAKPHGLYLLRNGVPTNYFAPNFDPPYTTKMTRSLLINVLNKSWDNKRREWTPEPVPRLVTPATLITNFCGCSEQGGFMANEVTNSVSVAPHSTVVETAVTMDDDSNIGSEPSGSSSFIDAPKNKLPPSKRNSTYRSDPISESRQSLDFQSSDTAISEAYEKKKNAELRAKDGKSTCSSMIDREEKKSDSPRCIEASESNSSSVLRSNSNMSLDYSMDSSLLGGGDSSVTGNYFTANDGTACSYSSKSSKRSSKRTEQAAATAAAASKSMLPPDESESSGLDNCSIASGSMASGNTSASEAIPTDQELFDIGWAKALDLKSGSYYYFTLDRSKIIWENPLLQEKV